MVLQQLVNGQIIITAIANHSITNEISINMPDMPTFEPCVDAYDQYIFLTSGLTKDFTPLFDHYGQPIFA